MQRQILATSENLASPDAPRSELLTISEAAETLRVSQPTLRKMLRDRDVHVVRLSPQKVFIRRGDVQRIIDGSLMPLPGTTARANP